MCQGHFADKWWLRKNPCQRDDLALYLFAFRLRGQPVFAQGPDFSVELDDRRKAMPRKLQIERRHPGMMRLQTNLAGDRFPTLIRQGQFREEQTKAQTKKEHVQEDPASSTMYVTARANSFHSEFLFLI